MLFSSNRTVNPLNILPMNDSFLPGATQGIVDLNNDLVAGSFDDRKLIGISVFLSISDLFLTVIDGKKPKFRLYELPISKMTLIKEYDPPGDKALYHLSTFADIGERRISV